MLWIVFAAMTLVIVLILIFPLLKRRRGEAMSRVDYDIVVYRDQLDEIDQEVERGILTETQADAARAEVHHRMLVAEDADLKNIAKPARSNRRLQLAALTAILVVVPAGAAVVYAQLGSPHLPGLPYEWRQAHDPQFQSNSAADNLKAQLQANPSASGYKSLAAMYFTARNYAEAAAADQRAIELGSTDAASWSALGEAIVMANGGAVVPEAMSAFTAALKADSQSERSRFYMGLAEAQIGNMKKAVAIWRDLEKTSDPAAPWMGLVRDNIASFAKQGGFDPATVEPEPPSPEAMSSALSAMTDAIKTHKQAEAAAPPPKTAPQPETATLAQDPMIMGMVSKLAAKMQANPGDAAGWTRLAHAYNVLNQTDKAREAIDHAVRLQPRNVDVLLVLAETQKAAAPGDESPPNFIDTMRQILKLDPANATALYTVGISEQKAGHQKVAREMWTKALAKVAPDDPLANAIHDRLGQLPK